MNCAPFNTHFLGKNCSICEDASLLMTHYPERCSMFIIKIKTKIFSLLFVRSKNHLFSSLTSICDFNSLDLNSKYMHICLVNREWKTEHGVQVIQHEILLFIQSMCGYNYTMCMIKFRWRQTIHDFKWTGFGLKYRSVRLHVYLLSQFKNITLNIIYGSLIFCFIILLALWMFDAHSPWLLRFKLNGIDFIW